MDDLEHYFEELKLKRIPEIYKKEAKIAAEKKLDYKGISSISTYTYAK